MPFSPHWLGSGLAKGALRSAGSWCGGLAECSRVRTYLLPLRNVLPGTHWTGFVLQRSRLSPGLKRSGCVPGQLRHFDQRSVKIGLYNGAARMRWGAGDGLMTSRPLLRPGVPAVLQFYRMQPFGLLCRSLSESQ